jgi:hypothetical protein
MVSIYLHLQWNCEAIGCIVAPNRRNRNKKGKSRARQGKKGRGIGASIVDSAANSIKGIGRTVLPSLFRNGAGGDSLVSAPNNVGLVVPRASFEAVGKAQTLADFDPGRSMRIRGNGRFWDAVSRQTGTLGCFTPVPVVNPYTSYRAVNVFSLDPRLFELARTYQYYAIRSLRVTYIPNTGTSSAQAIGASLAFGISQDALEYVDLPTPNATQVLEQNISTMSPIWMPFTVSYAHDGTRVWNTDPTAPGPINQQTTQMLFVGVFSFSGFAGPTTNIGDLYVDYVVDLYEPQPAPQTGDYTAILPHYTDGNGFVYGTGIYDATDGVEGEYYPSGFNTVIDGDAPGMPPIEEPEELKVALVEPIPARKFVAGRGHRASKIERELATLKEKVAHLSIVST